MTMKLETIQDCVEKYREKGICTVLEDGKVKEK